MYLGSEKLISDTQRKYIAVFLVFIPVFYAVVKILPKRWLDIPLVSKTLLFIFFSLPLPLVVLICYLYSKKAFLLYKEARKNSADKDSFNAISNLGLSVLNFSIVIFGLVGMMFLMKLMYIGRSAFIDFIF